MHLTYVFRQQWLAIQTILSSSAQLAGLSSTPMTVLPSPTAVSAMYAPAPTLHILRLVSYSKQPCM